MKIIITTKIIAKLSARGINESDVAECFENSSSGDLIDDREGNRTVPDTLWFISETNNGRELKIVYMYFEKTDEVVVKSAYPPNTQEKALYIRRAPRL